MHVPYHTALVTGASSGIGRALTCWLARRGVEVYALARREAELCTLRDELAPEGGTVHPLAMDISDTDALVEQLGELSDAVGGFDLVVANAGISRTTNARKLHWADVRDTIDVNISGAAATVTAALPAMVRRGRGHIVGMSSIAGARGLPRHAAYSASKAFLNTFLEGLRLDLASTNITVTCLQPGFVKTPLVASSNFKMPFMLEVEAAVEQIAGAIVRKERDYSFPRPTAAIMRVADALPNPLYDALGSRMFGKPKPKGRSSRAASAAEQTRPS